VTKAPDRRKQADRQSLGAGGYDVPTWMSSAGVANPDESGAEQGQILDIDGDFVGNGRALHGVGALVGELERQVEGVVHAVQIIAATAHHRVLTGAAIQGVVAVEGEDLVVAGPPARESLSSGVNGIGSSGGEPPSPEPSPKP
jgi:hypothetical protein